MSSEEPTSPASPEQPPPEPEETIIVDDEDSMAHNTESLPDVEEPMPQIQENPTVEESMPQEELITHKEEPMSHSEQQTSQVEEIMPPVEEQSLCVEESMVYTENKPTHIEEESLVPVPGDNILQEPTIPDEEDSIPHLDEPTRPEPVRVILSTDDDRIELPQEDRVEFLSGEGNSGMSYGLRRRRSMGDRARTPELPLNLQVGYRVSEGGPDRGTPSPCGVRFIPSTRQSVSGATCTLDEFRSKQQSFEVHIEDCDEEEIAIESDGEGEGETPIVDRPITPVPMQDYGSVTYTEGPQTSDYLQVRSVYNDCLTDVSDAESDGNEDA